MHDEVIAAAVEADSARSSANDKPQHDHIMIDCETLSLKAPVLVVNVGVTVFNPRDTDDKFRRVFYLNVEDQMKLGHLPSASTIGFWLDQQEYIARNNLKHAIDCGLRRSLRAQMEELYGFISDHAPDRENLVWSNGINEDISWLSTLFDKLDIPRPWFYRSPSDLRTLLLFHPLPDYLNVVSEVAHDALADAKAQARLVQNVYKYYGIMPRSGR